MMKRITAFLLSLVIAIMMIIPPNIAHAYSLTDLMVDSASDWLAGFTGNNKGVWNIDEYYLIDVQYSPTFVTVNYTYNTTNINNKEEVGDVTNVYYYELKDGRNSSTLSAAGVTIPGLSFDFRVYYNDIFSLGIYFGDTNIFQQVPTTERVWTGRDIYSDNGNQLRCMDSSTGNVGSLLHVNQKLAINNFYTIGYISSILSENFPAKLVPLSNTFKSQMTVPTAYNSPGYVGE